MRVIEVKNMNDIKKKEQLKPAKKTSNVKKTKKKKIDKYIPKTTSEIVLTTLFIALLIAVIVLGIKAFNLKKGQDTKKSVDLIIPVLETKTNNTFSVDLSEMKTQEIKEYKFMVTNYKDKIIASQDINYKIELLNPSESIVVKLYKNNSENNLLTSNNTTYNIEDNKLSKDKKNSDIYNLIIRVKEDIKEKDSIKIKITATN